MEASERVATVPSPLSGATKPSPQGRLPKEPGAVRSPSSAMPWRPVRSRRRSVPRGQVTCASSALREQVGDRAAAGGQDVEVDVHEPAQHVGRDGGHRRAAGAVVGRALARLRVRERARGRRDEDVARGEGLGDRRRRLDAVVLARGHDGEHRVGLRLLGLAAQRLPHVLQRLVDDHEDVLSGRHREAAAHDGADGAGETGHGLDATRQRVWRLGGSNVGLPPSGRGRTDVRRPD